MSTPPGHPISGRVRPSTKCAMKILLIALFVSVSLFLAGCGKEPAQITSESSTPSPSPESIVPESRTPVTSQTSVSETAPSPSATAKSALVFKTEAATKAASAYLNAYSNLLNDINARDLSMDADAETALNNGLAKLKRINQDRAELASQESQVKQALAPDEITRLLQYRKSLEDGTKTNQDEF